MPKTMMLFGAMFDIGFIIPFIVFGLVFTIAFVSIIISIVKKVKHNRIINNGQKRMAKFIQIYRGRVVNSTVNNRIVSTTQYYGVIYEVKLDSGNIVKVKSPDKYLYNEAQAFEQAGYFEVYVDGEDSAIANIPTKGQIAKFSSLQSVKNCSYCGSRLSKEETKCPHCGASKFEDVI